MTSVIPPSLSISIFQQLRYLSLSAVVSAFTYILKSEDESRLRELCLIDEEDMFLLKSSIRLP